MKNNGWSKYEKLILSEIKDLKTSVKDMANTLGTINTRVTVLEWKSGLWGALAGLITAIPTAILVVRAFTK